jgi:hypothetical protein
MRRRWLAVLIIGTAFSFTACTSRPVRVPVLLTPIEDATLDQLIEQINQYESIRTLTARVDFQFQSEKDAELGLARRYGTAEGLLVLARPGGIRLLIQAPVVKTKVAEMASDGKQFQVAVYPEDHRVFLQGTNDRTYEEKQPASENDARRKQAGAFARMRPQHFTHGLLIEPIDRRNAGLRAFLEEVRQVEDDTRPNAPRDGRIIRSYYDVSVIEVDLPGGARLVRKYRFDRTQNLLLVREQIFEGDGRLSQENRYDKFATHAQFDGFLPTQIVVSRPYDFYSVTIHFNRETIKLNGEVVANAFTLQKPPEWGDSVETIDLDKIGKKQR